MPLRQRPAQERQVRGLALGESWVGRAIYAALIISLSEAGYKVVVQKLSEVAGDLVNKLR
jgi:hypothetical protein